jgi:hypothetical protein
MTDNYSILLCNDGEYKSKIETKNIVIYCRSIINRFNLL